MAEYDKRKLYPADLKRMDEEALAPPEARTPQIQEQGIEEDDFTPGGIFDSPGGLIKSGGKKLAKAFPSMAQKATKPTLDELKKVNALKEKISFDELQEFYKAAREVGYPTALKKYYPDPVKVKKVAKELAPDEVRVTKYSQDIQRNAKIDGGEFTNMSGPTSKDVSQYIEKIKRK